jgi:hypothetical protein
MSLRVNLVPKRVNAGGRLKFIHSSDDAYLGRQAAQGDDWMHEAKFDGYRSQIIIDAGLGATQP